jgi:manganese transport system permease protein/manganese/iron transport system permease protein
MSPDPGLLDLIIEPLRHGFMLRALAVGTFISAVCAVLSCFVVLKGWSLVGDALSHAVLPGIVLAYILGLPMGLGALASGMACVALAGAARPYSRVKPDALLGIAFSGFLAVGLILLVATPSDIHFLHVLFGNLLGIEPRAIVEALAAGTITLAAVLVLRKDLVLLCFDPAQARVIGLSPGRLELILLVLVALTVVAALQAVGVVLVVAMLVTPGCIGFLLAERFDRMMLIAVGSAVLAALAGTLASFWLDGATGASIVLVQALLFVLAFAAARFRRGSGLHAGNGQETARPA